MLAPLPIPTKLLNRHQVRLGKWQHHLRDMLPALRLHASNFITAGEVSPATKCRLLLTCAALGIAVLAMHLGARTVVAADRSRTEAAAQARMQHLASALAQLVARQFESLQATLDQLENMARLRAEGEVPASFTERLRHLAEARRFGIRQLWLSDAQGTLEFFAIPLIRPMVLVDRAYFADALRQSGVLQISPPVLGRSSGELRIMVARGLPRFGIGPAGVALASLVPTELSLAFSEVVGSSLLTGALFLADGTLLAASQGEANALANSVVAPNLEAMQSLPAGPVAGVISGELRFIARVPVPGFPLSVGVSSPAEIEMAPHRKFAAAIGIAEGVLLLLIFSGAALWWQRLAAARVRRRLDVAEASRLASAAQLDNMLAVLEGVPSAISVQRLSREGGINVEYVSAGFAQLMLMTTEALAATGGMLRHFEPPLSPIEFGALYDKLSKKADVRLEHQMRRGDGSLIWVVYRARLFRQAEDSLTVISQAVDITGEKAATEAAMAAAKLATLGTLSASLAHELNQPLTVIGLAVDTAKLAAGSLEGEAASKLARPLDSIKRMTQRARQIITHLRLFARNEPGEMAAVDLAAVLDGARLLVGPALAETNVRLLVEVANDLPAVWGNQILLEQVLVNLLVNARDAMRETPLAMREIRLTSALAADAVLLHVADCGHGFGTATVAGLFTPFFTTKAPGEGLGLGLSICHGIMQAAGGALDAVENPTGGAIFTMRLRLAPMADNSSTRL